MTSSVGVDSFTALEETWQRLLPAAQANTIFFTPYWQRIWWQKFGHSAELSLLSLHKGSQLLGIAPLMREEDILSFIGDTDVCDYLDFIVARGCEAAFYEALLDHLDKEDWTALDLHCLAATSPTLTRFAPLAEKRGYSVELALEDVCPRVDLPQSWDEYLALLGKKDRHELRRKMRRLFQSGETRYYALENAAELAEGLQDFFRLHRQSRQDKAEFMTEEMAQFFRQITTYAAEMGHLKLYFLEIDGVRTSTALCFDYGDELSLYNSGFDPAYASLSVGLLLKAFCLKEAIAAGRKRFDFLRGAEPYKYDLGGRDLPIYRCLVRKA